jgi:alkylation response protein AidB-like acyl-CoA dehydrogenase
MSTLSFERGTAFLSEQVRLARMVDELVDLARRVPRGGVLPGDERPAPTVGGRAIDDDEIARRLATARAEVEALRSMTYRSVSRVARTGMPSAEASLIRLFFSELQQRVHALAMEILGPSILEWDAAEAPAGTAPGAKRARIRETWVFRWLISFASTIAAGSKDIQRNIIGDRVLGLPR